MKIRDITRWWINRVMFCYQKILRVREDRRDISNLVIIISISIILLILAVRVFYRISIGEQHEEIEFMILLLVISMYCVIKTGSFLLRARKSEKLARQKLKKMMELEHCVCIGRLAQGIIHDLMNPLSAITLYVEELSSHPDNREKFKEMINKATLATKKMNRFMTSAKHHIDLYIPINTKDMTADLEEEVRNVYEIISYGAKVSEVQISIIPFEKMILQAHPTRIHQILINIIGNALEAKPDLVSISAKKSDTFAEISISDNGCGMPDSQLQNLFTKPKTTKANGTGIGLTCVHSIIKDELGGKIEVFSAQNVGTKFIIQIPLAQN